MTKALSSGARAPETRGESSSSTLRSEDSGGGWAPPRSLRSLPALSCVIAVAVAFGCKKTEAEPDHPIERAELVVTTTPPIAVTVPAVVKPGSAPAPIALTSGIGVAITITVFQDGHAVPATFQEGDSKVFRRRGNVMYGDTPGSSVLTIYADKARAPLEIPVTVKDQ